MRTWNPRTSLIHLYLLSCGLLLFGSCASLGRLALLESSIGRGAVRTIARGELGLIQRHGLKLTTAGEVAIGDLATFRASLASIRMRRSLLGRRELYVAQETAPFAEVVSGNTIRMMKSNQQLTLPGTLYRVRGNLVNIRVGPGKEYAAFRKVHDDLIVLVEAKQGDWCRVNLGDEAGWVSAILLGALMSEADDQ